MYASGRNIGGSPISVSSDAPRRTLTQRPNVSLVSYDVSADSCEYFDAAVIVNLGPQNVLRVIISDAADDIARVTKTVPLNSREQVTPQILPDEP